MVYTFSLFTFEMSKHDNRSCRCICIRAMVSRDTVFECDGLSIARLITFLWTSEIEQKMNIKGTEWKHHFKIKKF